MVFALLFCELGVRGVVFDFLENLFQLGAIDCLVFSRHFGLIRGNLKNPAPPRRKLS